MQRRQSGGKVEPKPGRVKHCKYLCRGAQRWRHQNANGAAQPKRWQDASGCENVSLLIAQAFQCSSATPSSPYSTLLFPSLLLALVAFPCARVLNCKCVNCQLSDCQTESAYPIALPPAPLLVSSFHCPSATMTDGTRVCGNGAACGMGHVVPFVAISWALFLFFVCN